MLNKPRGLVLSLADSVIRAYHDSLTKWVEKAELAKFAALFALGGCTHDALDCKLVNVSN